jgi:2'-5' RNA ligase
MPRCFVGVMVPEEVRKAVAEVQKPLSRLGMDCKLVETENLHICLSFLGDVDDGRIGEIEAALDGIGKLHGRFSVGIGGVKFIPSPSRVRVIVLEAAAVSDEMERIRKDIVKAVGGDSKPPHLTICRVKRVDDTKALVESLEKLSLGKSFVVGSIELIKSDLGSGGPVYTVLHKSMLSAAE